MNSARATDAATSPSFAQIVEDIRTERARQVALWGKQEHPNGTSIKFKPLADAARNNCRAAAAGGANTWMHVMREKAWEALSTTDRVQLRAELVQVIAVGVAWIEHLDESA